jgi:hypothetical protein
VNQLQRQRYQEQLPCDTNGVIPTQHQHAAAVDGNTVIANRFELPEFQEVDEGMSPSQITVARIKNKMRDDWMSAEQQLKLAIMDSIGETIRHIIAPPPMNGLSKHVHLRHN